MGIASTTLKEYIADYKDQQLKLTDYFTFEWLNDESNDIYIKTIEENILSKHTNFLSTNKTKVTITDDEYRKYRCNAHWLSQDVYGTTELWFLILHANELYSESEFNTKEFYIYSKSVLDKLSEIISVEEDDINNNRASITSQETKLKKKYG